MDPNHHSELAMRLTRALLFTGADRDARRSVAAWRGGPQSTDERLLRDLGDTYNRLEAYSLDIDVQRLRLKNNPVRIAPLARRALRAGPGLFPHRSAQGGRAAHRFDGDSAPRARRQRPARQVHPPPSAARAKAVMRHDSGRPPRECDKWLRKIRCAGPVIHCVVGRSGPSVSLWFGHFDGQ